MESIKNSCESRYDYYFDNQKNMIIKTKAIEKEIKGIIFDLDGTLINSEPNYYESERNLLRKYGIDFTLDIKKDYVGTGDYYFIKNMKEKYNLNESIEYLLKEKQKLYIDLALKNTKVFGQMDELLKQLNSKEYPMAIATGSTKDILKILIEVINIKDYFQHIVSSEEVENGKPEPDVFLETANRMNILPENIVVFEDSKFGIEAAKKANMYCIAIPEPNLALDNIFYQADILFDKGMDSFDVSFVIDWISGN